MEKVKKSLLILTAVALMLSFTGCSNTPVVEPEGAEKTVIAFADALAAFDVNAAQVCLKDGATDKIVLEGGNYDRENITKAYINVGISEETAGAIMDKVMETNRKAITYAVKDVVMQENQATVTMTYSVKDMAELWNEILISDEVLEAYGSGDQGEAVLKSYNLMYEKLDTAEAEPIDVVFTLENAEGIWLISEMGETITEVY